MRTRSRVNKGVPTAGQFATEQRAESSVTLQSDPQVLANLNRPFPTYEDTDLSSLRKPRKNFTDAHHETLSEASAEAPAQESDSDPQAVANLNRPFATSVDTRSTAVRDQISEGESSAPAGGLVRSRKPFLSQARRNILDRMVEAGR